MLFLLTGDVQEGKTRWLTGLVDELKAAGVTCYGMLSPGVWRQMPEEEDGGVRLEKVGIEMLLLPQGQRLPFATRRDLSGSGLARGQQAQAETQSHKAGLGWEIDDEAIRAVNRHLDAVARMMAADAVADVSTEVHAGSTAALVWETDEGTSGDLGESSDKGKPGLLVVDELGILELERDGGFTSAVRLLDEGPVRLEGHALAVVRSALLDKALTRFSGVWDEVSVIHPDAASHDLVVACFT